MNQQDQARLKELSKQYPFEYRTEGHFRLVTHVSRGFEVSKELAKMLIHRGGVWRGKERLFNPKQMLHSGVQLDLHTPPDGIYGESQITPEMIVHEEDTFLVLNKPPGWYCVGTPWDVVNTLEYALARYLKQRDGKAPTLHLVHRLDHQTSGLLVVSKSGRVNSTFQQSFNQDKVDKRYQALAVGAIEWDTQTLLTGHSRGPNGIWRVYPPEMINQPYGPNDRKVRDAKTTFTVRERMPQATLVEAELHTGRTHQIRLHLHHIGHPIWGDSRYGGPQSIGDLQISHHLLHAWKLTMPHPLSGYKLTWEAALPALWEQVITRLQTPAE